MPTEPMITYFHDASSDARVRRWPTKNAVATVVPSIATHVTAALPASSASSIVATNNGNNTPKSRRSGGVGVTEGELGVDVSDRGPHCEERDARDEEHHERGERVGAERTVGETDRRLGEHADGEPDRQREQHDG